MSRLERNVALVKLRIPSPKPPLLDTTTISNLLDVASPTPVDVTAWGPTRINSSPRWRGPVAETFPTAKVETVGGLCHHGATKVA